MLYIYTYSTYTWNFTNIYIHHHSLSLFREGEPPELHTKTDSWHLKPCHPQREGGFANHFFFRNQRCWPLQNIFRRFLFWRACFSKNGLVQTPPHTIEQSIPSWINAKRFGKLVVSDIVYFRPYFGKIPILTNIFGMGWNHQPDLFGRTLFSLPFVWGGCFVILGWYDGGFKKRFVFVGIVELWHEKIRLEN